MLGKEKSRLLDIFAYKEWSLLPRLERLRATVKHHINDTNARSFFVHGIKVCFSSAETEISAVLSLPKKKRRTVSVK